MQQKVLSELIDPEVLFNIKKTISPCIKSFSDFLNMSNDMNILKLKLVNLCKKSELEKEEIRPIAWKILLKILPSNDKSNIKTWIDKTISDRKKYEKLKQKEIISITKYKGDPLTANFDTNIINENNNWDKFYNGSSLRKLIEKDVRRTFQNKPLFKNNAVKEFLTDILYFWCVEEENKKISYKQGMNDILSILFFAIFPFYFSDVKKNKNCNNNIIYPPEEQNYLYELSKNSVKNSKTLYLFFHDENYLSHDLFAMFSALMNFGLKDLFEANGDFPVHVDIDLNKIPSYNIIPAPNININNNGINLNKKYELDIIYKRCIDIMNNKLRVYDEELYKHILANKIDSTTFMVRWLRCLFCREFSDTVSIQIWDVIFLEEYFQNDNKMQFIDYIVVAMFENIRKNLLKKDEEGILQILFNYPKLESPKDLIKSAYKIRTFFENKKNKTSKIKDLIDDDPPKKKMDHVIIEKENIEKDFRTKYIQIPLNKEGITMQNREILKKLEELQNKYQDFMHLDDLIDFRFCLNELKSKLNTK